MEVVLPQDVFDVVVWDGVEVVSFASLFFWDIARDVTPCFTGQSGVGCSPGYSEWFVEFCEGDFFDVPCAPEFSYFLGE